MRVDSTLSTLSKGGKTKGNAKSRSSRTSRTNPPETTLREFEQTPQFILLQFWNIWRLKFWSRRAMLLETTRRQESSHVIYTGYQKRRGIEQTSVRCHHRPGRCLVQHPGCSSVKEDRYQGACTVIYSYFP